MTLPEINERLAQLDADSARHIDRAFDLMQRDLLLFFLYGVVCVMLLNTICWSVNRKASN